MTNEHNDLSDAVKASVTHSGALANLKQVTSETASSDKEDLYALKDQAQNAVENIQQLLTSGKLDDGTSQKLNAVLSKLRSALGKDGNARVALAAALAEASTALTGADGESKNLTLQQKTDQLWQQIEADNKAINDDFEKMREAGINFNDKLWNRHNELTEYLETHPRDIKAQKELDAVDDALLLQAESQLNEHPNAKPAYKDAKDKSKDRHEKVDKDLVEVSKKETIGNEISMADFDEAPSRGKLTMNDVASPSVGQKPKSGGRHQG